MDAYEGLLDQLEDAVGSGSLSRRADVLRRVTDLFMSASGSFSEPQLELFDEVMTRLVQGVELAARAAFGSRLASAVDAPLNIIKMLAFDPAIEVAGPVLSQSTRVTEQMLVENARTMSQDHLLAISRRMEVNESVTDVLLARGNPAVVASTAENSGSRFSGNGFSTLVDKALKDNRLALCVWSRPDIPRHEVVSLFQRVSDEVRAALEAAKPRQAHQIRAAVAAASERLQHMARAGSGIFRDARHEVQELHAQGRLDEAGILRFARAKDFDRTAVALACVCDVSIGVVERALVQKRVEQVIVLAKAARFSWDTAKALLLLKAAKADFASADLDQYCASFSRLQAKTANTALQFYRLRDRAGRV
ncbi:DUF2336 domain-containing protein [Bradyrhizobium sp. Tv2a-2]|uniref:DUF2336 domain-containing protein n=1 Tax=Bradyrhizobium sp. Tv2a-2 TaxID=113395 RepID=UPI00042A263F|nr:DUF2336 domain-containing protein [Bradyrhizobium sp. Tv2a-2]